MGVLNQSKDAGAAAVLPNVAAPVDKTGFFSNIGAGFQSAVAGPHSTRVGDAIYQKKYYDQIIQALAAEGEQGEDKLDLINNAPVKRPFRNPFVSSPWENLTNSAHNPLADLYGGGDRAEMQQIWNSVIQVRQRKPDFLKQFPNPGSIDALSTQERQKQIAAATAITSRASTAGSVGGFVGGMAGSVASMDPENTVGGGFGTAAGKTVARTVVRRAVEGSVANAAAATIGVPGQMADAEHLGQEMTAGNAVHQVLESAAIGAGFGAVHAGAPHVAEGVKAVGDKAADVIAAHAPAPVRDVLAAASLRAGTVRDRSLLTEYRRLHSPYAAVGDISTPEERSAGHVLVRDVETREASPFHPEADAPHQNRLSAIANDLGIDLSAKAVPSPAPVQTPTVRDQSASAGSPRRSASYEEAVHHAEGTGKNPDSTADGHFQFTEGTWLEYAPRVTDTAGKSRSAILALRHDLPTAQKAEQLFRADNGRYLRDRGIEDSPGNLSLAHFLGRADAAKVLRADPATPIERLVDSRSLASNRSVLAGKSASEVVAWAHKRIGAAVDGPVARADAVADDYDYGEVPPYSTAVLTPDDVKTDAGLMQYKSGGDVNGVTAKLNNVTAWNPIKSADIMVWEPRDGGYVVVDGHQRTGLAKRLYPDDPSIRLHAIVLKEADGITAAQARVIGALRNIGMGTGSLEDNARVLRDAPSAAEQLEGAEHRREIQGLANLNYEAFGAVLNNVIDPRIAAEIGIHAGHAPERHMALVGLARDLARPSEAATVVRQALADGFGGANEHQLSLLADQPQPSLYVPIARIFAAAQKKLREEKRTFKVLGEKAGRIEAAGNVLDKTANEEKVIGSDEALGIIDRTAHSSGPVRDALIAAARAELSGARRADAVSQFLDALAGIDLRAAAAGDGRLSTTGELAHPEGDLFAAETPDGELAGSDGSLLDRAVAAKEKAADFSDPVGEAAKAQTDLIEHDLLMDAVDEAASSLFDTPETGYRLSEEGDAKPIHDIMRDAESDELAAEAMRNCLQPPKVT